METYAIIMLICIISVPSVLGGIFAWVSKPPKYYVKLDGYYLRKKY